MGVNDQRERRPGEPVECPYCGQALPRPATLPLGGVPTTSGGRCGCGAYYLLDATGREGGELLLQGLMLLSGGDLASAMELQPGTDYELCSRLYDARVHCLETRAPRRGAYGLAKLWFLRRVIPAVQG